MSQPKKRRRYKRDLDKWDGDTMTPSERRKRLFGFGHGECVDAASFDKRSAYNGLTLPGKAGPGRHWERRKFRPDRAYLMWGIE